MPRSYKVILLVAIILIADQVLKIWVKTHMQLGQSINILGNWFLIQFTENKGAAFGWLVGGDWGKLILSLFRIALASFIIWHLPKLIKNKAISTVLILSIAGILAGAIGNIIDSMFYGLIFSDSVGRIAEVFPRDGGYASFLFGHVVDMFFFPLFDGSFPQWLPFIGGQKFLFFSFIFNIADSAVFISLLYIILFQRKSLAKLINWNKK
jgi:signal peptidase II